MNKRAFKSFRTIMTFSVLVLIVAVLLLGLVEQSTEIKQARIDRIVENM